MCTSFPFALSLNQWTSASLPSVSSQGAEISLCFLYIMYFLAEVKALFAKHCDGWTCTLLNAEAGSNGVVLDINSILFSLLEGDSEKFRGGR